MTRLRSSLLWGAVGGLSFLVLAQGYELAAGVRVGFPGKLGVALLVVAGSAALSYLLAPRLAARNGRA